MLLAYPIGRKLAFGPSRKASHRRRASAAGMSRRTLPMMPEVLAATSALVARHCRL